MKKGIILIFSFAFGILLILSVIGCDVKMSPIESEDKARKFVGDWKNEDPDTDHITKAKIELNSDIISVYLWGKCLPVDCDWGVNTTNVSDADDEVLSLTWNQGFAIITQEITLTPNKRLKINDHEHFIDNSGRKDFDRVCLFIKQ